MERHENYTGVDFREFFQQATGYQPYPYQERLSASSPLPPLLDIPTALGKTAAIVIGWLWRRLFGEGVTGKFAEQICAETPHRLIYCLPMRVLVEQTAASANQWLENLVKSGFILVEHKPNIFIFMGGRGLRND